MSVRRRKEQYAIQVPLPLLPVFTDPRKFKQKR
jgi:hypothetical protein